MNKWIKTGIVLLLGFCFINSFSQNEDRFNNVVLFTDRDYCMSGDTVWFKAWMPENLKPFGNVVRVQFETAAGNIISIVAKKAKNNWAEGYFVVPDSLSTGQCFVSAFLNAERNIKDLQLVSRSLLVYNRFENQLAEINVIPESSAPSENPNPGIQINTGKEVFSGNESVDVTLSYSSEIDLSEAIIKAVVCDPLSSEIKGNTTFFVKSSDITIPDFMERNGVLVNGKVFDTEGNPKQNALVVLSITQEPPYFDYYLTGEQGDFHFFLKNAVGKAKIVMQVISDNKGDYQIKLDDNYLTRINRNDDQVKILTNEQSEFIGTLLQANFIHRIFNPVLSVEPDYFNMPNRFSVPFYGTPTNRVIPDEFIDLSDFREISRELLPGLQYRIRNDEIIFRMINQEQSSFFDNEPLRLLNGIPVFKNNLFAELKSTDINYIDIVQHEKIFGDFKISGVLSVSLYDKSNFWTNQIPGISEFQINCLQPDKEPVYQNRKNDDNTVPDLRRIYLWQKIAAEEKYFNFNLSDIKGKVEVSVEGITIIIHFLKPLKLLR